MTFVLSFEFKGRINFLFFRHLFRFNYWTRLFKTAV